MSGLIAALERRIGDHIGLARRAGQAVSGFEKAREWLRAGRAALVIQAADGSPEERARFLGGSLGAGLVPVAAPLSAERLGAIFGRERAVHVAVLPGRLAERLLADAQRLAGLRGVDETAPTGRGQAKEHPSGVAGGSKELDQAGR